MLFSRPMGGEGKSPLIILHGILGSSRNWGVAGPKLADFLKFMLLIFQATEVLPPCKK